MHTHAPPNRVFAGYFKQGVLQRFSLGYLMVSSSRAGPAPLKWCNSSFLVHNAQATQGAYTYKQPALTATYRCTHCKHKGGLPLRYSGHKTPHAVATVACRTQLTR